MDNPYRRGNKYGRTQSPPYFIANKKIFWPSLPWETAIIMAAADPLHVTRPVVEAQMAPLLFFDGESDGLLINTLHVKYTGAQNSVNTLFIYSLYENFYYCIGAINLPVSADFSFPQPVGVTKVMDQGDPGAMLLPPILLGESTQKFGLRLGPQESIYLGLAQPLTSAITVTARGRLYSRIEKVAASIGSQ